MSDHVHHAQTFGLNANLEASTLHRSEDVDEHRYIHLGHQQDAIYIIGACIELAS